MFTRGGYEHGMANHNHSSLFDGFSGHDGHGVEFNVHSRGGAVPLDGPTGRDEESSLTV